MRYAGYTIFLCLLITISPGILSGQVGTGIQPEMTLEQELGGFWSLQSGIALRYRLDKEAFETAFDRVEGQVSFTWSGFLRFTPAGGYLFKLGTPAGSDHSNEHRVFVQLGYKHGLFERDLAHRLRMDHRILDNTTRWRIRYRIGSKFPLSGNRIDRTEPYFFASNEPLFEFGNSSSSFENRLLAGTGWILRNGSAFQAGLEYRLTAGKSSKPPGHLILLRLAYTFELS